MILYLTSNKRTDISFAVNHCESFTHNTKASHENDVNRICWYIQGNKFKGLVFNTFKRIAVYCYVYAYFSGLRGHDNPQDPMYAKSRTVFVVTYSNFSILLVPKLKPYIALYTLHYEYM